MLSALFFGETLTAITMLTMTTQTLPIGRTAATLTAVYGLGQVVGPLVVAPAIGDSYSIAFAIAVLIIGTAGALRASRTASC